MEEARIHRFEDLVQVIDVAYGGSDLLPTALLPGALCLAAYRIAAGIAAIPIGMATLNGFAVQP